MEGVFELLIALSFEDVVPNVESLCTGQLDVARVSPINLSRRLALLLYLLPSLSPPLSCGRISLSL